MRKFKLHVLVIFSIFLILILTNYKINLNASVNNDSKIEQEKLIMTVDANISVPYVDIVQTLL